MTSSQRASFVPRKLFLRWIAKGSGDKWHNYLCRQSLPLPVERGLFIVLFMHALETVFREYICSSESLISFYLVACACAFSCTTSASILCSEMQPTNSVFFFFSGKFQLYTVKREVSSLMCEDPKLLHLKNLEHFDTHLF